VDKKKPLEKRQYTFEIRAEENESGSVIVGRPIVYESKTDLGYFDEIIHKGALDHADLTDVRFLVNHDTSKIPLARSRKNTKNSTMQFTVDENGMTIRVNLDTENNSEARNLYSAVKRGDITGMSFMFGISDEEWEDLDTDHPTRHIREISTVVEVSAVTFPAYESTEINTRGKAALDNARSVVETARQSQRKSVETDLELEKLKAKFLYGL
jgi:HK97 family phage prohead protease